MELEGVTNGALRLDETQLVDSVQTQHRELLEGNTYSGIPSGRPLLISGSERSGQVRTYPSPYQRVEEHTGTQ